MLDTAANLNQIKDVLQSLKMQNSLKANITNEKCDIVQTSVESIKHKQQLDTVSVSLLKKLQSLGDVRKSSTCVLPISQRTSLAHVKYSQSHDAGTDGVFLQIRDVINKHTGFESHRNSTTATTTTNNNSRNINHNRSGGKSNDDNNSNGLCNNRSSNGNSSSDRISLSSGSTVIARGPSTRIGTSTLLIGDSVMRGIKKRGLTTMWTSSRCRAEQATTFSENCVAWTFRFIQK